MSTVVHAMRVGSLRSASRCTRRGLYRPRRRDDGAAHGKIARMRILALDTSTEWLSVAARRRRRRGTSATSARARRTPSACCRWSTSVLAEAGWRSRDLDGIAFGAGPGLVHRRAHRLRRRAGAGARRRAAGGPRRHAGGAGAGGVARARRRRACSRASTRACARSMSPPTRATASAWTRIVRRPRCCKPDDVTRCRTATAGTAPATASPRIPRLPRGSALRGRRRRRCARRARAIGELALPRLAAGEGVAAARRAAALRAPSRRADHAPSATPACGSRPPWRSLPRSLRRSRSVAWRPLRDDDLAYVAALEAQIHAAPWTLGNFRDALAAGYRDARRRARRPHRRVRRADARRPARRRSSTCRWCPTRAARASAARCCGASSTTRGGSAPSRCFLEVRVSNVAGDRAVRERGLRADRAARRATIRRRRAGAPREDALVMRRALGGLRRTDALTRWRRATRSCAELGLAPRWRAARSRAMRAPATRAIADARAGAPTDAVAGDADAHRAHRGAVVDATSPPTSTRAPPAAVPDAHASRCRAWATPHAEWLFVGEAPGAEEDARGEPFVGQAGRLLDNMLAALGHARGAQRLHRQRAEVPAAEQPHARARARSRPAGRISTARSS